MKVILTTNIKKLGKIGELVKVKDGYAHLPSKPGLGIELDWDFIENTT